MQSALAKRPIKNRLFSLSLVLQALIYGYVDWEVKTWIHLDYSYIFGIILPHISRDPLLYYWASQYDIALRRMPTLKTTPHYFCAFCESRTYREEHKISNVEFKYSHHLATTCTAMCNHLDYISQSAHGNEYYRRFPRWHSYSYKEKYDLIYEEHFKDPDNKSDKADYEEFCLLYPERRIY